MAASILLTKPSRRLASDLEMIFGEETSIVDNNDKRVLGYLVREIKNIYHFKDNQPHNNNANGIL